MMVYDGCGVACEMFGIALRGAGERGVRLPTLAWRVVTIGF